MKAKRPGRVLVLRTHHPRAFEFAGVIPRTKRGASAHKPDQHHPESYLGYCIDLMFGVGTFETWTVWRSGNGDDSTRWNQT